MEIEKDTVNKLSWKCGSKSLQFHKDEEWLYDDDEAFPVDEDKIDDRLELFEEFGVSFVIEDVEDYGQYGLDNPECTITLETEDETYEILLGDYSTMDSKRYVSIGDGNAYLVNNDPLEYFDIELKDMVKDDEAPDFEQVKSMEFSGSTSLKVVYKKDELICSYQDEEIESDDFLTAIEDLTADSFTDEEASQKEEIEFTLRFKDDKYTEMKVEIYRYDGEFCLVAVDGETQCLVERSQVVDLIEAVNAIVLN